MFVHVLLSLPLFVCDLFLLSLILLVTQLFWTHITFKQTCFNAAHLPAHFYSVNLWQLYYYYSNISLNNSNANQVYCLTCFL